MVADGESFNAAGARRRGRQKVGGHNLRPKAHRMLRKLASAYGRTLEDTFQRILRFVCSLPEPLRRAIVNEDPARRELLIQGLVELMRQEGLTIDPQQEMYLAELDRRLKKFADDLKESQQAAWRAHAPGQDNQSGE